MPFDDRSRSLTCPHTSGADAARARKPSGVSPVLPSPGGFPCILAWPLADALAEGVETFRVDLSGASGAALAYGQAVGRIHDPGQFFSVTPCRVLDTRGAVGPHGGPAMAAGESRTFGLAGRCGIPSSARAVAVNLTVTAPTTRGNLRLYPANQAVPPTSSLE